jgi:hypothetical protein
MNYKVYVNNIFHGVIESNAVNGKTIIHIPEPLLRGIGNKYFYIDLFEV